MVWCVCVVWCGVCGVVWCVCVWCVCVCVVWCGVCGVWCVWCGVVCVVCGVVCGISPNAPFGSCPGMKQLFPTPVNTDYALIYAHVIIVFISYKSET